MELLGKNKGAADSRKEWLKQFKEWDFAQVREGALGLIAECVREMPNADRMRYMPPEFWPDDEEEEEEAPKSDTQSAQPSKDSKKSDGDGATDDTEAAKRRDEVDDARKEKLAAERAFREAQEREKELKREATRLRKEKKEAEEARKAREAAAEALKAKKAAAKGAKTSKAAAEKTASAKKASTVAGKVNPGGPSARGGAARQRAVEDTMQVIDLTGHAGSMSWQGVSGTEGAADVVKTTFVIEDSWPPRAATPGQDDAWLEAAIGHVAVTRSALRVINPDVDDELMRQLVEMELRALGVAEVPPDAIHRVMEHVNKVHPHAHVCSAGRCGV